METMYSGNGHIALSNAVTNKKYTQVVLVLVLVLAVNIDFSLRWIALCNASVDNKFVICEYACNNKTYRN